ncbi:transcription elongation factor B polypeptide 3-like isoform X1 [Vanessa atalanta]|uniref:transcription elongation factor B polypeptide 3-like isoform X1 n=1 Tax=Vanessa atalanta TaxID=42275 RepID=UPI001FCDA9FC|nr:transcription elongation factor B polypeptide 3-like isoform X1 [Vanessa atalanta]
MASVLDLVKHYQHSIEKYPNDEQKVLKCIDKLYNLTVTVQHLQETGVGRTVNALRKEPGDVGQAARALVYKWKTMVAAEESDQEEHKNDTTNYNGHENGKYYENDSSDSRSKHDKREKSQKTPKTEERHHKHTNGDYGNKRKYQSSEDEESETKKCKYSSTKDNGYKVKSETKTARDSSESEMDSQADSSQSDSESEDSQSSEEERKPEIKMVKENHQSSSTKHLTGSQDKHKPNSYSDISLEKSEKHHTTNSSDIKSLPEKLSSKDKSHNSHSHKSSKESEHHMEKKEREHRSLEIEKRHKSESSSKHSDKHRSSHSSEKQKSSGSSDKHRSSSSSEKQKSNSNPEKHRSSSNVEKHRSSSSSDKHKSNTTEKHKNNSDKAHSSKSEKEKHKLPSEKEISNEKHKSKESRSSSKDKHTSASREKTKDKSSSSKEKDHSSKSEKKHSSSKESKSSDEKRKSESSNREKSNRKSKDKSSSKSSSSKSKDGEPKKKDAGGDSDDGIDCGSGASFAEALGMVSPAKPKKKSVFTKDSASPNSNDDMSPATLLAPTAKLAPLPTLEISALPEISPNYRPRPPPKFLPHFTDEDAMNAGISSKNQRTKVYSGNKVIGKIPTLYEMCVHILQEHIDSLEYTGGVPYDILKPVVDRATAQQLFVLEHYNPYLMEDTDHLWQKFCEKNFRNKKRQEMETWREMYMRCQEEQEIKLKSLTANIRIAQEAKKAPIKQTKMAYVDSVVKPPRNVAKKQAQHGTAFAATASPAARVASLAAAPNVLRGGRPTPVPTVSTSSSFKPKKAPLMQKALQFLRGRKR